MLEKKALGKCTMNIDHNVLKLYLDSFVLLFHFRQFYQDVTNTFGKTYLTLKMLVSEKTTNSGGLMLVCRWARANALAQNKLRSTIYLLSQHLLA